VVILKKTASTKLQFFVVGCFYNLPQIFGWWVKTTFLNNDPSFIITHLLSKPFYTQIFTPSLVLLTCHEKLAACHEENHKSSNWVQFSGICSL